MLAEQEVRVCGPLKLPQVDAVRDQLLAALAAGAPAVLDVSGMDEIDAAGLQLLCAAGRTFEARGAGFELRGMTPRMLKVAADCGFLRECDLLCALYEAAIASGGELA